MRQSFRSSYFPDVDEEESFQTLGFNSVHELSDRLGENKCFTFPVVRNILWYSLLILKHR